ncbi:MAG TPA: lipoyl synthase [Candidatus Thermoplasmatota archaeon]|jgi:lipoic acid synthetase|nr:lipoyl synthase [Candidatus Thermoplasmatota archaeon]
MVAASERKPEWFKVRLPGGENYQRVKGLVQGLGLSTICEEGHCPNIGECWGSGTMTLMLMGDTCTRGCRFCNVKTAKEGQALDPFEPHKVAWTVSQLGLEYVVLTMVDRDDLPDQGAAHVARTIASLKQRAPKLRVEVLTGDFRGDRAHIATVLAAKPDVFAHNLETIERLQPKVRDPRASYAQSLGVLRMAKDIDPTRFTKSSLMLGLGETDDEVLQAMADLRAVDCDVLTLGQYLRPSAWHLEVQEYVPPARFDALAARAKELGFLYCAAGPLVRSSYKAGELFLNGLIEQRSSA